MPRRLDPGVGSGAITAPPARAGAGAGTGDGSSASARHQSSLGTFITGETFYGVRGRSLPLHGLEAGINDNAYSRGLLIHGTPAVSEARALRGTMGLTEGCAGVPSRSAKRLIGLIGQGTMVFVWYPDREFLENSAYLDEQAAAERSAISEAGVEYENAYSFR